MFSALDNQFPLEYSVFMTYITRDERGGYLVTTNGVSLLYGTLAGATRDFPAARYVLSVSGEYLIEAEDVAMMKVIDGKVIGAAKPGEIVKCDRGSKTWGNCEM